MIQLVSVDVGDGARLGLLEDGRIYLPRRWRILADLLQACAGSRQVEALLAEREPAPDARLLAPIPAPRTLYFAGANYKDHVEEMRRVLSMPLDPDPRASGVPPWHGIKAVGSTIVGPGAVVQRPDADGRLDWELELAVIIGWPARNVRVHEALSHVLGYTIANDLSARDHVGRSGVADTSPFKWDWVAQKSFDGSCPLGPAITLAHDIGDVQQLAMKLWVGDELMQDSSTAHMIFGVAEQIAWLSSRISLQPGDVILTGTPAGVGMARQRFLRGGDVVRQWIERIGNFEFSIR